MNSGNHRSAIVFHCPFPVNRHALRSANMARPVRMLEAFKSAGFRVIEITGNALQRQRRIRRLKRLMAGGLAVDFVYSESSNLPLFFSEADRVPRHPFLEYRFFWWVRRKGIPIGLFLRDLYWRFPLFGRYPWYKRLPAVVFYWLDWLLYMSRCDHVFLPSLGLSAHLPTKPRRLPISVLLPGCEERLQPERTDASTRTGAPQGLLLFYVGGVTAPLYDLTPMLQCAEQLPEERFVVCCRQDEWEQQKGHYGRHLPGNVRIVHAENRELSLYYRCADLFVLAREPHSYLGLAAPYKVFESVAFHLPIVTLEGTEAARLIREEGMGWVARDVSDMVALIAGLRDAPDLIRETKTRLHALAGKHSWRNRVSSVVEALGSRGCTQSGKGTM